MNKKRNSTSSLNIFASLQERYQKNGLEVLGSYAPYLKCHIPFNYVVKRNNLLSTAGHIANDEAFIMHSICEEIKPKRVLIIGNGYGVSTVFLSLCLPKAKLVAFDKYRTNGIKITKKLLAGLKDKFVIQASTPDDLDEIITKFFNKKIDLVFSDAVHENKTRTAEFLIYEKYLTKKSCVFFDDLLHMNLRNSFYFLKKKYRKYEFKIFNKSSSGLGVCFKKPISKKLNYFLNYFSSNEAKALKFIKTINLYYKNNKKYKKNISKYFKIPEHPQL